VKRRRRPQFMSEQGVFISICYANTAPSLRLRLHLATCRATTSLAATLHLALSRNVSSTFHWPTRRAVGSSQHLLDVVGACTGNNRLRYDWRHGVVLVAFCLSSDRALFARSISVNMLSPHLYQTSSTTPVHWTGGRDRYIDRSGKTPPNRTAAP